MDNAAIIAFATVLLETAKVLAGKAEGEALAGAVALASRAADMVEGVVKNEQKVWKVQLVTYGDCKIQCIKIVRNYTELGLKEAKELVETAPCFVLTTEDRLKAENMCEEINHTALGSYEHTLPMAKLV